MYASKNRCSMRSEVAVGDSFLLTIASHCLVATFSSPPILMSMHLPPRWSPLQKPMIHLSAVLCLQMARDLCKVDARLPCQSEQVRPQRDDLMTTHFFTTASLWAMVFYGERNRVHILLFFHMAFDEFLDWTWSRLVLFLFGDDMIPWCWRDISEIQRVRDVCNQRF